MVRMDLAKRPRIAMLGGASAFAARVPSTRQSATGPKSHPNLLSDSGLCGGKQACQTRNSAVPIDRFVKLSQFDSPQFNQAKHLLHLDRKRSQEIEIDCQISRTIWHFEMYG